MEANLTPEELEAREARLHRYREILDQLETLTEIEQSNVDTVKKLRTMINDINNLKIESDREKQNFNPNETIIDSEVLASSSGLLVKTLQNIDVAESKFELNEFAAKLQQYLANENQEYDPSDLLKLSSEAEKLIPSNKPYYSLYGCVDLKATPKERKKKTVVRNKENVTKKAPIEHKAKQNDDSIDKILKQMYKILLDAYKNNDNQAIGYYDFVINSEDFGVTVNNILNCTFLINQGRVRLDLDSKNNPTLSPVTRDELKFFKERGGEYNQVISSMSMDYWESLKREGLLQKYMK